MKKLLTLALLLCAFLQARADTWTDSNGINYELHSNGTATVISGDYSAMNHVRIPSSVSYETRNYTVTSIAANAFAGCTEIYGLTLPATLTSIGDNAFADIPSWCIVYSLNTVPPTINSTVFPSLSNLKVAVGSVSAYQSAQGWQEMNKIIELTDDDCGYKFILHDNNTATLIRGSWEPGTIWDLSSGKIVFFDGYQDIELTITGIEPWGFTMCNDVTIVKLPPGMTTIEQGTFYQCSSLSEITIPESVTSIDMYAFYGCPLTSLTCNATTPPEVSSDAFTCYDTATLSVPMSSEAAYRNHEVWGRFNILCIATYDGIRYRLNTDGTATVFSGDYSSLTSVNIPATITSNGTTYRVTGIGKEAFAFCKDLASVTIPEGVTSIGDKAFRGCSSLTSVNIPEGVTSIGGSAFSSCSVLTSVNIPSTVTSIGDRAFMYCNGLTSVTIPEGVTSIGDDTFNDCDVLASVTIPVGVTSIGDAAFMNCRALTSVTIPSSVTSIGNNAFTQSGLTSVTIPSSVTSIGWSAFSNCSGLTSVTISSSVTSIDSWAFSYCTGLTNVTCLSTTPPDISEDVFSDTDPVTLYVPEGSVSAYQNHAVWGQFANIQPYLNYQYTEYGTAEVIAGNYSSLTNVTVPSTVTKDGVTYTVTSIGDDAFKNCTGLTSVTLPESVTGIRGSAFKGCSGLTSINIPDAVTLIGTHAFYGCSGLTSVTLPSSLTDIGAGAFQGCTGLTSVTIPSGVTGIDFSAFGNCTGLTSVTFSEGVESIGASAFQNCTNLTSVTIPSTVTLILSSAFANCNNLSTVTCLAENPPLIDSYTFATYDATLYVPEGCDEAYRNHELWGQFTIKAPVTATVGSYTYKLKTDGTAMVIEGAATLRNANIPETVTYEDEEYTVTAIGSNAFANSSNLKTVVLPATLTEIRPGAFYGTTLNYVICQAQTPPSLPTRNLALRPAFGNISSTPLYVPEGRLAAYNAANGWKEFAKIFEIQTTINNIQYALVPGKREVMVVGSTGNLTKVIIPGTVTYMGVSFDVTSIGPSAFLNKTNLRQVAIGEGVKTIGDEAFRGCTRITEMTLPSTLEELGVGALYGLTNLTTIYCNATTPPTVNRTTFNTATYTNCTLYVPYGSVSTYKGKSYWKYFNIAGVSTVDGLRYRFTENGETLTAEVIEGDYSSLTSINMTSWVLLDNKVYVVKGIGDNAFNGYTGLTNVSIAGTVTSIGSNAFSGCTGLTRLTIPESVATIGNSAFRGCTGLTNVTINSGDIEGEGLESIGASAFRECYSLTSVNIPSTVTSIGRYAFQGCTSLTSVICDVETPPSITSDVFSSSCYDNATLYVPGESETAYREDAVWGQFSNILASTATIDGIKYSFNHTTGEATVIFQSDYSGDINIPETVTCDGVTFQVTEIGQHAFALLPITSVSLPSTLKVIGWDAFRFCSDLTDVTIPSSVTMIRSGAFANCSGLTDITIPSSVRNIGEYAFLCCTGLKSVTILDGCTNLSNCSFIDIYAGAFQACTSLTTVFLPASVGFIGMSAFAECTNLNTVYCDAPTPLYITSDAFSSYDTATLFVPAGSIEAYEAHEVWGLFNTVWDKDAELYSGDVNGDKRINVGDFIATGSFILGRIPSPFIFKDGDINEDGNINVGDFIAIGSIILHSTSTNANSGAMSAPRRAGEVAAVDLNTLDNALYIAPVAAVPGTQAVLSLRMKNAEPTTGFELTLRLPEGVTVATGSDNMPMAELSEERTSKSRTNFFATSLQADGTLKVLCGTNAGSQTEGLYAFSGNDGEVARITVNIPDDYVGGDYAVSVLNGALADVNASTTELAPELTILNSSMTIQQSLTGINVPVSIDGAPSGDYYTLDGLKLEGKPTKKGIYILNGKKVFVK